MNFPLPKHSLREYIAIYQKEHTTLGNKLTHMIGIPMIVASLPTTLVNPLLGGGLFATGWALQFAGHYMFEKNKPAFYSDPYYLLVGPAWVAAEWIELVGLPVPEMLTPAAETRTEVHARDAIAVN
ncbi:MAG TPA: DUF962 domain-containing protein [Polyangiaceae bacterium]|nr:DUF962 domain-containing protein [Polyangiaceae bacterium]